MHVRSGLPNAVPVVLTHGWPSSYLEFLPLIEAMERASVRHGIAFDLVLPSLPGFAYSKPMGPTRATPDEIARLWRALMREVLGYPRFGAYGGDIGSHVANFLGANHADCVLGIYTHHPQLHPTLGEGPLSPEEQAYIDRRSQGGGDGAAYAAIQSTRPDTLAASLNDSPAGLAAWIVEKLRAWSDCGGEVETRFSKDAIIDIVMLYWVTGTIGTSFGPYWLDKFTPPLGQVTVPAGITLTQEDRDYPVEFARRTYKDIRSWHPATIGGHFFAFEEPALLAEHLCSFFSQLPREL